MNFEDCKHLNVVKIMPGYGIHCNDCDSDLSTGILLSTWLEFLTPFIKQAAEAKEYERTIKSRP